MELPGPRANPTYPGMPMAGPDDFGEGVTQEATILPHMPVSPVRGSGRASLIVTLPGTEPRTWPLGIDQIVGRAAGPGVIVVADPQVSRRHARISWEGGHFVYRDLGPMNPTRREGRTLPNPYVLRDGDRLLVGRAELLFRA
jgi:hypothetical protein